MKFVRIKNAGTGLVVDTRDGLATVEIRPSLGQLRLHDAAAVQAIESVLPAHGVESWNALIDRWHEVRGAFQALVDLVETNRDHGLTVRPFNPAALDPPLASPTTHIFSLGSNTAVHIQRAFKAMKDLDLTLEDARRAKTEGLPPAGFTIWPDSVVGPTATITPPRGTLKLDYEAECAVYVGRGGRNLSSVNIWGFAAWNDLGIRDLNLGLRKEGPWTPFSFNLVKNFDTGNACGPWFVVDEGHDITNLRCVLTVNGEVRQDWNLSDMIYSFEESLRYISEYVTLRPGDMLTSGTGAGVAIEGGSEGPNWLKPGDVVSITLDGAGTLTNVIGSW